MFSEGYEGRTESEDTTALCVCMCVRNHVYRNDNKKIN